MRSALVSALCVAACLAGAALGEAPRDLTVETFDEAVGGGGVWMVEFYGSRCGHCKRLEDNYNALAERVAATPGWEDVHIAKVNANEHMALAKRYNAFPWPSIKLFTKGTEEPASLESPRGQTGSDGVDNMFAFIAREAGLAGRDEL